MLRHDFQQPQTTELLWVYEGLTRYLNWVLAARAGILNQEEARDYVALLAAQVAHRSGREWRSLQETAISAGILNDAPEEWQSLRRGADYYDESLFLWLEADTVIRRQSKGKHSLNDFCRAFFAASNDVAKVAPYTFADLIRSLNLIESYDWEGFFRKRLDSVGSVQIEFAGLTSSGWKLMYGKLPGSVQAARDIVRHMVEERFTVGLLLRDDGTIVDIVRDSPAWEAGLGPGMKVVAVGGQPWSPTAIRKAIADDVSTGYVSLSVRNGSELLEVTVKHAEGSRFPVLEKNQQSDVMSEILSPISSKRVH